MEEAQFAAIKKAWRERISEDFWEALAAVEHIAMPFPVSLVLADDASPSVRGKVEREGLSL